MPQTEKECRSRTSRRFDDNRHLRDSRTRHRKRFADLSAALTPDKVTIVVATGVAVEYASPAVSLERSRIGGCVQGIAQHSESTLHRGLTTRHGVLNDRRLLSAIEEQPEIGRPFGSIAEGVVANQVFGVRDKTWVSDNRVGRRQE